MVQRSSASVNEQPIESLSSIKPGLRYNNPTEEKLQFTKQLGVRDVIIHPLLQSYSPDENLPVSTEEEWSFEELVHLRNRIEDSGLRMAAIENLPVGFYDEIMLGKEGRDEQIEHVQATIRNMGRAGIQILGYNWMPSRVWRTSLTARGRGETKSTAFELDEAKDAPHTHDGQYTESEFWDNYEYFLERAVPVAENAGVTLCLHPDDPPVEELGGLPRLFRNFENLNRAMELVPSDHHQIELCLGTVSGMNHDVDVLDVIRHFGDRNEICYVHFRDVEGTVPSFQEVFIDEGNYDEFAALETLREVGFDGMVIPDHVPQLEGEREWQPSGRAYTIGYLKGMLKAQTNPSS